jgi:branched-chain amino acid transport system permease protein
VWAVVAQGWNLVIGVSGIHSFGQLALYALGGYTTGVLSKVLGVSPWLGLLCAPVIAVMAALLLGVLTLRLRGAYTVLLTLAFHELLRQFVANGPQVIANGGFGLLFIPRLHVPGLDGPAMDAVVSYHLALLLFIAATLAIGFILRSPVGLAFQALRDAETYAVCRGVDPFRHKLFVFAVSAVFTGLAGGLMTHHQGAISPSSLDFGLMIQVLAMIVIGGWGTFHGPIVGAATMTALIEVLERFKDQRPLVLGLTLALVAVLAPQGLLPLASRRWRRVAYGTNASRS